MDVFRALLALGLVACTGTISGTAGVDASQGGDASYGDALTPTDARDDVPGDSGPAPDAGPAVTHTVPRIHYETSRRHSPVTDATVARLSQITAAATRDDRVFAKLGDSITETSSFLYCFDGGAVELGARGDLAPTLEHFRSGGAGGTSPFARDSVAAVGGWTAAEPLAGAPSPLAGEVSALSPAFAVVMFGTNDLRTRTIDAFAADLWTIVDELIARGVVPIVFTIPPITADATHNARVPLFNLVVRAVAQGRHVPLVDYHRELVGLSNRGISDDGIHPSESPRGACMLEPEDLAYGYNVRNLLALEALDRARSARAGVAGDATAPTWVGQGDASAPYIATPPFVDLATTRDAPRTLDVYSGCGSRSHPGGEALYRIELAARRTISAQVFDRGAVDVDVQILEGTPSGERCVAAGDRGASATVGPGTVWISVDAAATTADGEFLLVVR